MKKIVIVIMLLTVVSKLLGFTRDIALSYFYGASSISDAFLISYLIPTVIFGLIGGGISSGFIPMYTKIIQNEGEAVANKYTNNLINIFMIFSIAIVFIGLLFTDGIVEIFAPGFENEIFDITVSLTKITIIGIVFSVFISILIGFLQIKGNYTIPSLIGLPLNIIIILFIVISYYANIIFMAIGILIAIISQLIFLLIFSVKAGYKYRFILDIRDKYIKKMLYIAIPIIVGTSANQINIVVDKSIASLISAGGISTLTYAQTITGFVHGIFVLSISTALYPKISEFAAAGNIIKFKKTVALSIGGITLLIIPATVSLMVFSEQIVEILYGRGAFNSNAVYLTSNALFYYSLGIYAIGVRVILSKAFYSLQDTKTPMINATIALVLNIILNIVLSKFMGLSGLALATSISAIICMILLLISLRRKIGTYGLSSIIVSFIKIAAVSIVMGLLAKLTFFILYNTLSNNVIALIISIFVSIIFYLLMISILKITDISFLFNLLKNKFRRN